MTTRQLVLISGPIASGKTTAARGLADRARLEGSIAAAIDMDEMIESLAGDDWSAITTIDRRRACRATAAFVQASFESGATTVAIAGSTLSPYEWNEVTRHLCPAPAVTHVLLRVSVDESIRRAKADPTRASTKDASYVRKLAAAIDWSSVPPPDIEVQTDDMTPAEVVTAIASRLASPSPWRRRGGQGGEV